MERLALHTLASRLSIGPHLELRNQVSGMLDHPSCDWMARRQRAPQTTLNTMFQSANLFGYRLHTSLCDAVARGLSDVRVLEHRGFSRRDRTIFPCPNRSMSLISSGLLFMLTSQSSSRGDMHKSMRALDVLRDLKDQSLALVFCTEGVVAHDVRNLVHLRLRPPPVRIISGTPGNAMRTP